MKEWAEGLDVETREAAARRCVELIDNMSASWYGDELAFRALAHLAWELGFPVPADHTADWHEDIEG